MEGRQPSRLFTVVRVRLRLCERALSNSALKVGTKIRDVAKRPVNYSWLLAAIQSPLIVGAAYCIYQPARPGVAVVVLGLVAIVMSIRTEDKWGHYERAGWFVFAALLVIAEIQAGIVDRNQHDAYEHSVRNSENKQFQAILDQNQKDFDKTLSKMQSAIDLSSKNMKLSENALQQITGGGAYCFLMATVPVATTTGTSWELAVMNAGEYPLDICHVLIHENFQPKSPQDAERLMQVIVDQQLGPLPPGKTKNGSEGFMTKIILPAGSYYIQINTRDDRFYETLTIHPEDKSKGLEDVEVRDQKWNIVYQQPEKK